MAWAWGVRLRRLLDVFQYAVALTAVAFVALAVICLPLGFGFVGVKIGLFLVGVAAIGYGTYLAWPSSPEELEREGRGIEETPGFQRLVRELPPAAWYPLHRADRYPDWVRVYAGAVAIWLTSFAMEAVFGVVA
ncbi:MAG: hypothetical protein ABEI31_01490 [Halodesulfurarchaeum sp.]